MLPHTAVIPHATNILLQNLRATMKAKVPNKILPQKNMQKSAKSMAVVTSDTGSTALLLSLARGCVTTTAPLAG